MYPSVVSESSHSMKPPWIAGSPSKGFGGSNPTTTPVRPRIGNKSPTPITALFRDDVAGAEKQGKTVVSSDLKEGKEQIGEDPIADLFADDDLRIPGLRALLDSPKKLSPRHRREESSASFRSRASSSSLGNDILEADLRSLSLPAVDMDVRPSPRTPRQKHVAHVQQVGCFEDEVTRSSKAVEKALRTATKLPLVPMKSVAKNLDDQAHDKADEWGETDVSLLLPIYSKIEGMERDTQEMSSLFQNPVQLSKAEPAADHEFGDYQPSILSGPKRSPLRGRRSSQEKGLVQMDNDPSKQKSAEPPVKKSYIKLKREPETSEPGMKGEGPSALEELCGLMPTPPETKRNADKEKMPILNHSETFHHRFVDDADCVNEGALSPSIKSDKISSPDRPFHQVTKSPLDPQSSIRAPHIDDEDLSSREKEFCNHPLVEKNLLQSKLDSERYSFEKERDAFQTKLGDERDGLMKKRKTLEMKLDAERNTFIKERETLSMQLDTQRESFAKEREALLVQAKKEGDQLYRELQHMMSAKESTQKERDALMIELKNLRDENLLVKEEALRIEHERLSYERQVSDAEKNHENELMKKVSSEREEAQLLASQLSFEVHLLKSSSMMAEEKLVSMQKLHEQELQMTNNLHLQELQAKDKQLETERKFLADHKTTMDKLSKLFNKGDEGEVRLDALRQALVVDAELSESERQKWMGALDHTVVQSQAIIKKWEDYCNSIRKQLDQLVAVLELGVKEVKTMRLDEKDRLDKEHSHIEALQGALQKERAQSLTDLITAHEKLEELRSLCFLKKEEFLTSCTEERKEIDAERQAVIQMRKQLVHAEVAFEKQVMEHAIVMQAEDEESTKQRKELERAKEMAAELAEEVEKGQHELQHQRHIFEREIASVQSLSVQAEMKVESAMGMKKEAAQLKLEAEALRNAAVVKASDIKNQKLQAALAHSELLELKQKHDDERMRLAIERQRICSKRNGHSGPLNTFVQPLASQIPGRPFCGSKPQLLDITAWNSVPKRKRGQQTSSVPVRSSLFSTMSSSFGQTPWVVENIEVSLCLQAQEDFLADAKRALENTTYTNNNLVTKAT